MNILFLSQVLPYPLDAGPKVRSYYVLRYLAQFHDITLVAFTRATDSAESVAHLASFCRVVRTVPLERSRVQDLRYLVSSFFQGRPFLIARDDLRSMDNILRAETNGRSFDCVHADQLAMAHYALRLPRLKRVLDQHNAVWTIIARLAETEPSVAKRLVMQREARLLRRHEAETCAQFDRIVTVTEQDRQALAFPTHPPRSPLEIIPICIDPFIITPIPFGLHARDVVCVGGMFYPPNVDGMVWFAHRVLPLVWRESPETKFYIVGARPDPQLVALGKSDPRIIVTGYVENTNEYLERAAAFVVPLRAGGGMRVKILDAWARGVPMVSTTIGAEGIEIAEGENILIADTPDEFSRRVLRMIQDRAFAREVVESGYRWVKTRYAWQTVYKAWDSVYPPKGPKSFDERV